MTARPHGIYVLRSQLELGYQLPAGTTAVPSGQLLVALRRASDDQYWDFTDGFFRSSGWTTRQASLAELSAANAPGYYRTLLQIDGNGLAAEDEIVAEYAINVVTPAYTDYATEVFKVVVRDNVYAGELGQTYFVTGESGGLLGASFAFGVDGTRRNPHAVNSESAPYGDLIEYGIRHIHSVSLPHAFLPFPAGGTPAIITSETVSQFSFTNCEIRNPRTTSSCLFRRCVIYSTLSSGTETLDAASRFEDCVFQPTSVPFDLAGCSLVDCVLGAESQRYITSEVDNIYWRGLRTGDKAGQVRINSSDTTPSTFSDTHIEFKGRLRLGCETFAKWGPITIHIEGELELDSTFDITTNSPITVTGTGTITGPNIANLNINTDGLLQPPDIASVEASIAALAADELAHYLITAGLAGLNRVNEVTNRDGEANAIAQEIRIYDSGINAEADDGSTGLIKKLPNIIGEFVEQSLDSGGTKQVLTRLRMSDFQIATATANSANDLSAALTATATGGFVNVSESTDFSAGLPSFLTEVVPVGQILYTSGNAVLDANGAEADYTNDNVIMLAHALPAVSVFSIPPRLRTNFASPADGTAQQNLTFVGVFFEDEVNDFICSWGCGRDASFLYREGQRRAKGVETYNFWGFDLTIGSTNPPTGYASIQFNGLFLGNAVFEGFSAEGVSEGTVIVSGMGVPTRCGLMFMSFQANTDPSDRVAFSDLSIDYSYTAP